MQSPLHCHLRWLHLQYSTNSRCSCKESFSFFFGQLCSMEQRSTLSCFVAVVISFGAWPDQVSLFGEFLSLLYCRVLEKWHMSPHWYQYLRNFEIGTCAIFQKNGSVKAALKRFCISMTNCVTLDHRAWYKFCDVLLLKRLLRSVQSERCSDYFSGVWC